MTSISLPVVVAVGTTFLQMMIDSGRFSGWELAVAKATLALMKSFQPGGGPVAQLRQAHVAGVMNVAADHHTLLKDFPSEAITPESVKAWGESMVKDHSNPGTPTAPVKPAPAKPAH